jgi:predicted amidohydrolase
MIIFQPKKERITYSKQYLYKTEIGFVSEGSKQIYLHIDSKNIIAPAICYELSVPEHSQSAYANNANIYMASVLNSVSGVDDDIQKLSDIAKRYQMTTFMSNYIGQSGGYECAGKSSIWNDEGTLIGQLNNKNEGLLCFDTETKEVFKEMY